MSRQKEEEEKNTITTTTTTTPVVVRDPRFQAGRSLVQKGLAQEGAVEIFATLLEETRTKYGDSSIETAPAYYEYGNALLRAAAASKPSAMEEKEEPDSREVAAAAAEQRLLGSGTIQKAESVVKEEMVKTEEDEDDKKLAAVESSDANVGEVTVKSEGDDENDNVSEDDDEGHDLNLALEMMENSFSILEEYKDAASRQQQQSSSSSSVAAAAATNYQGWVGEQLPRVLLGIGDTLSALEKHADAADAYSRALDVRQEMLQTFSHEKDAAVISLEHLQAQRKVCEATVLICEELLACPSDQDVITTETQSLVVKASERVEYVQGYYDKARDALQETVFLMANVASRNVDMGTEKADVCFIATMLMGVGTALAEIDDESNNNNSNNITSDEPVKKKPKT